ncbi:MAG: glycolate oxidase subunit GlcD [Rariglobus sp.]|jgi:hypothetical protein|nr:glycolate oxidase subunit GlcD [Rariglobus sp.]
MPRHICTADQGRVPLPHNGLIKKSVGLHGLKYGVTHDYVIGLEAALADGSICSLDSKCMKDVAGYISAICSSAAKARSA